MNKICGIYKITSPTGKIYIGQSKNINRRKYEHKNNKCGHQTKIYKSIAKYGWNNHLFKIIYICTEDKLNDLEKYYIKLYNTFNTKHRLNLTEGGDVLKCLMRLKIK